MHQPEHLHKQVPETNKGRIIATLRHKATARYGVCISCDRRGHGPSSACAWLDEGAKSVESKSDLEPRGVTGELQVPAEIRQLFNFCGQHSCLGDMLLAAADTVTGFGEEATLASA